MKRTGLRRLTLVGVLVLIAALSLLSTEIGPWHGRAEEGAGPSTDQLDATGDADSSSALAAQITESETGLVQIPAGNYNLENWQTLTHSGGDLTVVGNGQVKFSGNGQDFIKITGGSLTLRGIEFDGFSKLVGFEDDESNVIDSILVDRVTFANSPTAGMISYFATTDGAMVNRLEIRDSVIHNSRQGINFQGRVGRGIAVRNEIYNTQQFSIRFGKDWAGEDWVGEHVVTDNYIHDQYNSETGSGHEANMIAVFAENVVISRNILQSLSNKSAEDCEGIYLKSRQFTVSDNSLRDVGMDEGAIVVKGHPGEVGNYEGASLGGTVTNNTIRFREQRDRSIGINVLRSDVLVSGNQITGAGVNGIRLSWRGPYENVTIENNTIAHMSSEGVADGGHPLAAILLFGYGRDIMVRNNTVNGAYLYGIRLENNSSSSTRYVMEDRSPIGDGITLEANTLVGSDLKESQGISVHIDESGPPLNGLRIVDNKISKFAQYDAYLAGCSDCSNWVYDRNILADDTLHVESWPADIYLGGIEWSGSDSLSGGSTTKTIGHTIPVTVSPKLKSQDITITPGSMGSSTKLWLGAINSKSIQIAADVAPGSSVSFGVKIALNRVVRTP